jgi:hypothetical protein
MLAHHPKTGKPIRIMRSEASIWRNQKTLIHLEDQDPTVSWDRWDTLTIGLQKMKQWMSLGKRIDYVVLTENTEENREWILSVDASHHRMIFISRALISSIGEVKFRNLRIQNIICIEEIVRMYPYMGPQWDTTKNDLIVLIGCLLRYMRISGLKVETVRLKGLRDQGFEVKLLPDTTKPPQLWFITQFYNSFVSTRNKELKKCIRENMKCSLIDKIVFLSEKDETDEYPDDPNNKIKQVIVNKRLTYKIVIQWIKENVPDDVICVFANADIYLDSETWRDIWTTDLTDKFIALLRYEVTEDGSEPKLFGPRNDSQDTWAVYSNSIKSRDWDYKDLDIMFGKAGCDNAITVEMLKRKFLVVNPALSLKTFHVHASQIRTYDPAEVVDRPAFMYVDPTGIHDMEPILNLDSYTDTNKKIQLSKFERRLHSIQPRVLDTYCKMMEREERYLWSAKDANLFKESALAFYKYKNVFQTPQGLVYGYNHLLIGRTEASKTAWSESRLSSVTPTYASERCLVVPWKKAEVNTSEGYLLYYVSKIMMMRERFGPGDFWAKDKESVKDLQLFNWSSDEVPVIPHSETVQIWCAEAIQYPWLEKQEVHKEEIDALRKALNQGWVSEPSSKKRWTVMIDEKYITSEMVRKWEETFTEFEWNVIYEGRTSMDRKIDMLLGSTGFLSIGGKDSVKRWGLSWVLPKGATYVEVQNEMDPCGEAAHVSGAAGLTHSLIIVPRASDSATQNLISKHFSNYLGGGRSVSIKEVSNLPILRLPRSDLTGYYAHAGDSFREMAKLWAEKGYVQIVEDPKAVQVWLGSVGDVLLYDRPNTTWLFTAPQQEQTWKKALFGNPKPVETGGPVSAWFFWPRRPRLVEQVVASGSVTKSWDERAKTLVFYGKIENRLQEKRRKEFDWSIVCDDFVMVQGETTPYSLTQEEYLLKLTNAKFGLCLAGFGNKCHREVECMAMGCVPVVAMNVDMESYAVPPIEGLHYLRVENPEDALIKVKSITSEKWTEMSEACRKWWRETASVEGSWALTQKLKGM